MQQTLNLLASDVIIKLYRLMVLHFQDYKISFPVAVTFITEFFLFFYFFEKKQEFKMEKQSFDSIDTRTNSKKNILRSKLKNRKQKDYNPQ